MDFDCIVAFVFETKKGKNAKLNLSTPLPFKYFNFSLLSSSVASNFARNLYYSMTWNYKSYGITTSGCSNSPKCFGIAYVFGNFAISCSFSKGNFQKCFPHLKLKIGG